MTLKRAYTAHITDKGSDEVHKERTNVRKRFTELIF